MLQMLRSGHAVVIISLVLIVIIGWILQFPTPPGFQEPIKLKVFFGGWTIAKLYAYWMLIAICGTHEAIRINRAIQNAVELPVDTSGLMIRDTVIDGVNVRIYTPQDGATSGGAVLYAHGGGWIYGNVEGPQHLNMAALAQRLQHTVISIDYRLAPEHPFPGPFDDCRMVVEHILTHAGEYGINPHRVALLGDSAGATLMAAVSLSLKDRGFEPRPKLQVLLYPPLQAIDFSTPSYQRYQDDPFISRRFAIQAWLLYAFGDDTRMAEVISNIHTSSAVKQHFNQTILNHGLLPSDRIYPGYSTPDMNIGNESIWNEMKDVLLNPYFSPLLAEDLNDLPPTFLITMGQDVLTDDGVWFVQRLQAAGNRVTYHHHEAGFHGLGSMFIFKDYLPLWEKVYSYLETGV